MTSHRVQVELVDDGPQPGPEPSLADRLKAWDYRLKIHTDELKFLLGFPIPAHATVAAVQAAVRLLEHARQRIGDEAFVILPGSQIAFLADATLPGEDTLQVVGSIDADGVIQYKSGLADTLEGLRAALLAGVAEIKPAISGSEPPEPGKSEN